MYPCDLTVQSSSSCVATPCARLKWSHKRGDLLSGDIYTKMWDLAPDCGSLTTGGINCSTEGATVPAFKCIITAQLYNTCCLVESGVWLLLVVCLLDRYTMNRIQYSSPCSYVTPLSSNFPLLWDCQTKVSQCSMNILLMRDHPAYVTTSAWQKGWWHKRGTTVVCISAAYWTVPPSKLLNCFILTGITWTCTVQQAYNSMAAASFAGSNTDPVCFHFVRKLVWGLFFCTSDTGDLVVFKVSMLTLRREKSVWICGLFSVYNLHHQVWTPSLNHLSLSRFWFCLFIW